MNSNESFDDSGLIISVLEPNINDIHTRNYRWPALFLIFFSISGILGNLFVWLAIGTERRLQNRTNWFLFSLALADMIVSGVVIPIAVVKEFIGHWILGTVLCDLWIFLDVCSCTSSIMHIVVISIDRYLAIKNPLTLRSRQDKRQICPLIVLIWFIAILLSSPIIILGISNPYNILINNQCLINSQIFVIYGSVVSFVIPLTIVIVMYGLTIHGLKTQIRQSQSQYAHEQLNTNNQTQTKPFLRRQTASTNALPTIRQQQKQTSFDLSQESLNSICFENLKKLSYESHYQPEDMLKSSLCQHCKHDRISLVRMRSNSTRRPRPISFPVAVNSRQSSLNKLNSMKRPWRRSTLTSNLAATRAKSLAIRNERKAVKVLGVVFCVFVIAWFPFCILNLLQGFCKTCSINTNILDGVVWLGYVSSSINPVVYTIFNRNFRLKFWTLLKCHCLYKTNRQRQLSYYQSHTSLHGSSLYRTNGFKQDDIRRFNHARQPILV